DAAGRSGVRQLANTAAWLVAAGVPVNLELFEAGAKPAAPQGATLKIPAHPPAIHLPPPSASLQSMPPPPNLVPILEEDRSTVTVAATATEAATVTAMVTSTVAATPATASPVSEILLRASEEQARVAALHQGFLAAQAEAHTRFLALQQSML